jgi:hypothetical protein
MVYAVAAFGVLIAVLSGMGVVQPGRLMADIGGMNPQTRYYTAIGVRLVMGVVFLVAAPDCHWPAAIQVLGAIAIVAAFGLAVMGSARIEAMIQWWLARTNGVVRAWCVVGVAFGVFVICAAIG